MRAADWSAAALVSAARPAVGWILNYSALWLVLWLDAKLRPPLHTLIEQQIRDALCLIHKITAVRFDPGRYFCSNTRVRSINDDNHFIL